MNATKCRKGACAYVPRFPAPTKQARANEAPDWARPQDSADLAMRESKKAKPYGRRTIYFGRGRRNCSLQGENPLSSPGSSEGPDVAAVTSSRQTTYLPKVPDGGFATVLSGSSDIPVREGARARHPLPPRAPPAWPWIRGKIEAETVRGVLYLSVPRPLAARSWALSLACRRYVALLAGQPPSLPFSRPAW